MYEQASTHPVTPRSVTRRRWLQMAAAYAGLALLTGTISACGGSARGETVNGVTKLTVGTKGDEMAFDQTKLQVTAGANVELTFDNHSRYLQHNWVLVNGGNDVAQTVYDAALAAGLEHNWLPPDDATVLAHTPLVDAGKSATITLTAPAQPGDYSFLCTFPGHFLAGMKGTLTVS